MCGQGIGEGCRLSQVEYSKTINLIINILSRTVCLLFLSGAHFQNGVVVIPAYCENPHAT